MRLRLSPHKTLAPGPLRRLKSLGAKRQHGTLFLIMLSLTMVLVNIRISTSVRFGYFSETQSDPEVVTIPYASDSSTSEANSVGHPPLSVNKEASDRADQSDDPQNTSSERHLVYIPDCEAGYGNQLECFNFLAKLVDKWNRVLWLPHNGYCGITRHDGTDIPLEDLYNTSRIPVRHHVYQHSKTAVGDEVFELIPAAACQYTSLREEFHLSDVTSILRPTNHTMVGNKGPFPHTKCLVNNCGHVKPTVAADVRSFPKHNNLWFPFHDSFYQRAAQIVNELKQNTPTGGAELDETGETTSGKTQSTLGLQVRRGDRATNSGPMIDCQKYGWSRRYSSFQRAWFGCFDKPTETMWGWGSTLRGIDQLYNLTSGEYTVVFVASDDATFVRKHFPKKHSHLLKTIEDFPHIFNKTKSDSVTALVVEMLVLSQMDKVLFSFQSSITEHVIRSRLQRNGYSDYDMELYRLYMQRFQDVLGVNMKGLVLRDSP